MKSFLRGFACAFLALGCSVPRAGAWQQQPTAPPAGAPDNPQPPNAPSSPDSAQPPEQGPGAESGPENLILPEAPKVPNLIEPDERGVGIGVASWYETGKPWLMKGTADNSVNGNIQLQGRPNGSNGWLDVLVNVPGHNAVRFTYWATNAHGSTIAPTDLGLITQKYLQGDFLNTDYRIKGGKIVFEYLSWPYPVKNSRFRLKTLWGMEYFQIRTGFAAPFVPTLDSSGNAITDPNGNPVTWMAESTYHYYLPTVGIRAQEYLRPTLRLEFSVSGFGIPHHASTWDSDAVVNWRFARQFELQAGAKAFHFHTSAKQPFWARGTQVGPFIGVRWYSSDVR